MSAGREPGERSRERTLLVALLMSAPGPLITGISAVVSGSATQLSDFLRRTAELMASFSSWWIYRRLARGGGVDAALRARLERRGQLVVAWAMVAAAVALWAVGVLRMVSPRVTGNVVSGLVIAVLGLVANGAFFLRYRRMQREAPDALIAAQQRLYRAKVVVDACVTVALLAVAVWPQHPAAQRVDALGSIAVSFYLAYSGLDLLKKMRRAGNTTPA